MPTSIDAIDRAILRVLQQEGKINNTELAERVGLSPSPCLRRVKQLEDAGFIERYVALVGQDEETVTSFVKAIEKLPQIVECHLMAGDCDFLLRVITPDLEGFRKFQMEYIGKIKGVRNIKSEIPMQQIKRSWVVPL
jgi:DNA-binding Lrp family transcriptional regulator